MRHGGPRLHSSSPTKGSFLLFDLVAAFLLFLGVAYTWSFQLPPQLTTEPLFTAENSAGPSPASLRPDF